MPVVPTTSFPEDADRLPEGMRRVAYDASTTRYAFRDETSPGTVFVGQPGEEYGTMIPESEAAKGAPSRGLGRRPTMQAYDRPVRFADGDGDARREYERAHRFDGPAVNGTGMTFNDILPAHLLGAAPPMETKKSRMNIMPTSPKKSGFDSGKGEERGSGFSGSGHERKSSFRGAARLVGKAAVAFKGAKPKDGHQDRGTYVRVESLARQ